MTRVLEQKSFVVGLIVSALTMFAVVEASATGYNKRENYRGGYVTAESQLDNRTVTAPVRRTRLGYQVLVPNWGWTDCEFNCRYTLRKYYLDFWDCIGENDVCSPGTLDNLLQGRWHW